MTFTPRLSGRLFDCAPSVSRSRLERVQLTDIHHAPRAKSEGAIQSGVGKRRVVAKLAQQFDQRAGPILIGDQLGPAVVDGVDGIAAPERGDRVFAASGGDQQRTLALQLVLGLAAGEV